LLEKVAVNAYRRPLVLALAVAAGVFAGRPASAAGAFDETPVSLSASGDFDADGVADQATLDHEQLAIRLSSHRGVVHLKALPQTLTVAAADIDHDGDVDLVSLARHGSLRFWHNEGAGTFTVRTHGPPEQVPLAPSVSTSEVSPGMPASPLAVGVSAPNSVCLAPVTTTLRLESGSRHGRESCASPDWLTASPVSPRAPPSALTL
jgi:hypothetical protein